MIKAADFLDFDSGASAAEKQRLVQLIEDLSHLPQEARVKLVQELLEIVANQYDKLHRRVQAATMLGTQSRRLGIQGDLAIAESLFAVVVHEFLPDDGYSWGRANDEEINELKQLNSMELLFFEFLTYAIFATSYSKGEQVISTLAKVAKDTRLESSMAALFEKAKQAKAKGDLLS